MPSQAVSSVSVLSPPRQNHVRDGLGSVQEHIRILWLTLLTKDIQNYVLDSIRVFAVIILLFLFLLATFDSVFVL